MNCCDINAIKKQKINKLAKKDTAIIIFDEKDIFSSNENDFSISHIPNIILDNPHKI